MSRTRLTAAAAGLAFALAAPPASAQESKSRPPKKGDRVVVTGCLDGRALTATDVRGAEQDQPRPLTAVTFRLEGNRTLLRDLREKGNERIVRVEGVLKSDLPREEGGGRQAGRVRITIGEPVSSPGSMQEQNRRAIPVLDVKSFEGASTPCRP